MKKILIAVPVILIAIVLVIGFYLTSIIKSGVETIGSLVTGVSVKLKDVDISLLSGEGQLKELFVGNPEGFKTESAFMLKEVKIALDVQSLFSDKIIIKEILVNAPDITYEKSGRSDNIKAILNNIESFTGVVQKIVPEKGKAEKEEKKTEKAGKKIQINDFIIKDGKVNMSATLLQGGKLSFPLKDIHIKDIGSENEGTSTSKALEQVFAVVNNNVVTAVAGETGSSVSGAVGKLKGLFGK
jgi:hypothetical protein